MYNFRILIQEIQLLRVSFRIYVLIAHGSAHLGHLPRPDGRGGGAEHWGPHEWGTLAHVQFLSL